MLEKGAPLHHIQKMLGHSQPSTTAIYLHVTRRDLESVVSPMDRWQDWSPPTF